MITTKILNAFSVSSLPLGTFTVFTAGVAIGQAIKYSYRVCSSHNPKVRELCRPSNDVAEDHIVVVNPDVTGTSIVENRTPYMVTVVAEVKNRFGKPVRNAANMLAVRKFALDIMVRHGVRPTHINRMMDVVVGMVFVSNDNELYSEELMSTFEVAYRGGRGGVVGWIARWLRSVSSKVDEDRI
jgi:hypothetical protein